MLSEGATKMEGKITLALDRDDAEILIGSLRRRLRNLGDIKRKLREPETLDDYEREELAFCERETETIERVLLELDAVLGLTAGD
jgi:hypothetical protein